MKIYTNSFELTRPSMKKVWTPQHSDYAIGVKVMKDGIAQDNSGLSVYDGDTCLSAEANEIAGNKIYKMSSGDPSVKTLDVRYYAGETKTTQGNFKLQVEATDTTVYDIDEKGETFNLPTASASVKGGIKVGANLSVDSDGVLNANSPTPEYVLPTATDSTLGGVKIGNNISITDGAISPNYETLTETEWASLSATAVSGKLYFVTPDAE